MEGIYCTCKNHVQRKYTKDETNDVRSLHPIPLWSKIGKNTDKIAIQSFTIPQAREWAKWASEWAQRSARAKRVVRSKQTSEQCGASEWVSGASERANGRASGPLLYVSIPYSLIFVSAAWIWLGLRISIHGDGFPRAVPDRAFLRPLRQPSRRRRLPVQRQWRTTALWGQTRSFGDIKL